MVQAIQAKTDSGAKVPAVKDKDRTGDPEDLSAGLGAFFAQYLAAMPSQPPAAPTFKAVDPPREAVRNGAAPDKAEARSRAGRETERPAMETGAARTPATSAARSGAADREPQDRPENPSPQGREGAAAAGDARAATKTPDQAASAPTAPTEGGEPGAPTASAKAATPEAISAAKAQAALAQIAPGGQVQFQFGDAGAQGTRKPALSELLNQPKVDIQAALLPAAAAGSGETPAAALPDGLGALQPQAAADAATATLLALAQPLKEPVTAQTPATGHLPPAETVGAGAVPGASGAVRVAPTPASEASVPVKRDNPMSQVDSSIRWLIKNKDQSAELQLHPEALGRVQIKLTVEGTEVHAKLWASEAAAVPVLQEHRAQLEASLKDQGLSLGSFDLQHGRQSDQTPLPQAEAPPLGFAGGPTMPDPGQDSPSPAPASLSGAYRIEIVA